jgi:ParB-like nuclease domain
MATIDVQPQVRMIALEQIRHDANVREPAREDVDALAGSIALLGQITPAIVRPDGDCYVLVVGHKRYAALEKLGRAEIRAEVRAGEGEHSERAAENIASCRRRHETTNADRGGMPTNLRSDECAGRRGEGMSAASSCSMARHCSVSSVDASTSASFSCWPT